MTSNFSSYRCTAGLVLALAMMGSQAQAQGRLKGQYTISMTGVSIGQIAWAVDINETRYVTSAQGKASGVLSVLVNGEGSVTTRGMVKDNRLLPSSFTSRIVDDEGVSELRMTFEDGNVKDLVGPPPPPGDRVPIKEADRHGVSDPLSAMLIATQAGSDMLAPANCNHVLHIFDGRRRYNLTLAYKRIDRVKFDRGATVAVLVCGVVLQPIAGYRADSMLVKYVAGRRDSELWFAPIAGTEVIAPVRVVMPTLLGTLEIGATQFETIATPPTTPPSVPAPVPANPQ